MPRKAEEYVTREFVKGDEEALTELFNSTRSGFIGFVPRTVEYWRWSCLTRPSVEEKGIVVVTKDEEIVGYAVVGKTGDVWELSYNNQHLYSKIIVEKLISFAVDYAMKVGADSVTLNEVVADKIVQKVCYDSGFVEAPSEQVFISVMDFPSLILFMLKSKKEALELEGTFLFIIKNCPDWCTNQFAVQISKDGISLFEDLKEPEATIIIDIQTITSLVFGDKGSFRDSLILKVHVQPFWKIRKCLRMLSLLREDTPWFIPKADIG